MGDADYTIGIKIDAKDNASAVVTGFAQRVMETALGFQVAQIGSKVADALSAPARAMAEIVKEGTLLAARNEMLATSLEVVGRVAGYTSNELERSVEAVKQMGITTSVSTSVVTRYMQAQLNVGKSSAEMEKELSNLARTAQDLAVVAGTDSSEALETLMTAASSMRPVLLRQFGIVDGLTGIYGRYAKTLNIAVDEMTEVQRRQAFLNTIFEHGERVTGAYEAAMGTVNKQIGSMNRRIEEAKVAIGEAYLPVMREATRAQTVFWETLLEIAPVLSELVTPAVMALADHIGKLAFRTEEWMLIQAKGRDGQKEFALELALTATSYAELEEQILRTSEAQLLMAHLGASTETTLSMLRERGLLPTAAAFEELQLKTEMASLRQYDAEHAMDAVTEAAVAMGTNVQTAWESAFDSDVISGMFDKLERMVEQHNASILQEEQDWEIDSLSHQFDYATRRAIAEAQHLAEIAQLRRAGDVEAIAALEGRYGEAQTLDEWHFAIEKQLRERDRLEAKYEDAIKFHTALQQQYDYSKRSIETSILKAKAEGTITDTAMIAMLGAIGSNLGKALITERKYAQDSSDVFWKWSGGVVGAVDTSMLAYKAWTAELEGDILAAEALMNQAQQDLEDFVLDLPPLELPDLPGQAAAAVAGTEQASQQIVASMAEAMAKGIESARQAVIDLLEFEVPEGLDAGLERFKDVAIRMARKFHEIWEAASTEIEATEKAAPIMGKIADVFNALADGVKSIESMEVMSASKWIGLVENFVWAAETATNELMPMLARLGEKWDTDATVDAERMTNAITKVMGLFATITDLMELSEAEFQFTSHGQVKGLWQLGVALESAADLLMPIMVRVATKYDKYVTPEVERAAAAIDVVMDLFSHVQDIVALGEAEFKFTMMGHLKGLWAFGHALDQTADMLIQTAHALSLKYDKDVTDEVERMASAMQKALGLLSAIDQLTKLAEYTAIAPEIRQAAVDDITFFAEEMIAMANDTDLVLSEAGEKILSVMGTAFQGLGSALDFVIKLSGLEEYAEYDDAIWQAFKTDVESLLEDIAAWDLTTDIGAVNSVIEKVKAAGDLVNAMRRITDDVESMKESGGLDIAAIRAIMNQFALFMTPPTGLNAPTPENLSGAYTPEQLGGGLGGGALRLEIYVNSEYLGDYSTLQQNAQLQGQAAFVAISLAGA